MVYIYKVRAVKSGEIEYMGVYSPLTVGSRILWGSDEEEPNTLKQWEVIARV